MDENKCYHLPIVYEVADQLDELVNMQKELQERIQPGFYDPNESLASIANFIMKNHHASHEEECEFLNALGGTHDLLDIPQSTKVLGSGVWKWWKADNRIIAPEATFSDLSERDQIEAKMELVDRFHFFMNEMIKIGMTGSELYSMYKSKNAENFNRQNNGY